MWRFPHVFPLFFGALALAQPYPLYEETPYVTTASPDTFSGLISRGSVQTIKAVVLGDSQETSPGGQGVRYMPCLNYEFYRRYHNAPATPLVPAWGSTGSGAPWADWLVRLATASPGPTAARWPASQFPPSFGAGACSTLTGTNVNGNQRYGCLVMLQHDAADTDPSVGLNTGASYFNRTGGIYMDVYATTNSSSGEVAFRVTSAPTHVPTYFAPTTFTAGMEHGLQSTVPQVKVRRFGFGYGGAAYTQVEFSGTDAAKLTDILAVQFFSGANPAGWTLTSMADGGYRCFDFYGQHPGADKLLTVYAPDVVFLAYGANDGGQGFTAAAFHANMVALIGQLRSALGQVPVIILSDPYCAGGAAHAAQYDQYPGAAAAIATEFLDVCAVNSRRLTAESGWTAANASAYLSDGTHYTAAGAILKARVEVAAIMTEFGFVSLGCVADVDHDGGTGIADLLVYLDRFDTGGDADLDDGSGSGIKDGGVDIDDLLFFLGHYESGC